MDSLDKFFNDKRGQLPEETPSQGHRERFEARIRGNTSSTSFSISVAAAVAILVGISFTMGIFLLNTNPDYQEHIVQNEHTQLSAELAQIEFFYSSTINSKIQKAKSFPENDELLQDHLLTLQELESQYSRLKKEMTLYTNDERIYNSIIQNYRLRLEVMEKLLLQLEHQQKLKKRPTT